MADWQDMSTAPKGATPAHPCTEKWILGVDQWGGMRVIRWCLEYPCDKGVWMFAYEPNDYIAGIQTFKPVAWMSLPEAPKEKLK